MSSNVTLNRSGAPAINLDDRITKSRSLGSGQVRASADISKQNVRRTPQVDCRGFALFKNANTFAVIGRGQGHDRSNMSLTEVSQLHVNQRDGALSLPVASTC